MLRRARVVDFQLLKRDGWYYAHICIKHDVQEIPVQAVLGIDLGIRRAIATVLLKPDQPLCRNHLSILRDGEKKDRLDRLNRRISKLQRAGKWRTLSQVRHKRKYVAQYFDHIDAIKVATIAANHCACVAVGYPRGIRYLNYSGNGKQALRRLLHSRFNYGQRIRYILEKCSQRGIRAEPIFEAWTSRRCHRCGSINTQRPSQSLFHCLNCNLRYNADWNSAINIGSCFFAERMSRRTMVGVAYARDELAHKPMSLEVRRHLRAEQKPRIASSLVYIKQENL